MIIPTSHDLGLGLLQMVAWVQVIRTLVAKMEDPNEMIESPCSKTECLMDDTKGHCLTCGRTRDDLANWLNLGPKERSHRARVAKRRLHDSNTDKSQRGD